MFKVAPYSFSYYLNKTTEVEKVHKSITGHTFDIDGSQDRKVMGKVTFSELVSTKSFIHIQANFKNDITKDLMDNDTQASVGKLKFNNTALDDLFLIFCFKNEAYNLNGRSTPNIKKGILFVVYEGRVNLSANILHIIESFFDKNIRNISPVHKNNENSSNLKDIIGVLEQIDVRAQYDRTGKKTDLSIIGTPEAIRTKYGNTSNESIKKFIDDLVEGISSIMGDIGEKTIIKKAKIGGHIKEIEKEGGEYVIKNLPQHLNLDLPQKRILNEIKTSLIEGRKPRGVVSNGEIINKLSELIEDIFTKNTL